MSSPNGLANLGNTCYLNSCIQILSRLVPLRSAIERRIVDEKCDPHLRSFHRSWVRLQRDILSGESRCVSPYEFVESVMRVARSKNSPEFVGFDQSDTSEFLSFMLECLHGAMRYEVDMKVGGVSLNRVDVVARGCYNKYIETFGNDYSDCVRLFAYLEVTLIRDVETNNIVSQAYDPSMRLDLPVVSDKGALHSIRQCISEYCQTERLMGDNRWYNENTSRLEDVEKQCMFWSLPEVLIVCLNRFTSDGHKLSHNVTVPNVNMDMSEFVCGYKRESYVYDLMGVASHSGTISGGHYTCNVLYSDKWWQISDSRVSELSPDMVITRNAYCLFFIKK